MKNKAVIGRIARQAVRADDNTLLIDIGDVISQKTLDTARVSGKLDALIAAADDIENPPGLLPIAPTNEEAYTPVEGIDSAENTANPPGRVPTNLTDEERYSPTVTN